MRVSPRLTIYSQKVPGISLGVGLGSGVKAGVGDGGGEYKGVGVETGVGVDFKRIVIFSIRA